METAELLNESFADIGKKYGYESVTAEFSSFKEFKVKWRRSCGWIELEVSDYLKDAPRDVMEGMADTIFSKITRRSRNGYPQRMMEWISSDDFVRGKQRTYMERSRNVTGTPVGEHVDLKDSYERLIALGLAERDGDLMMTWTKQPNMKRIGYCSVLMKVVIISSMLDSESVPEFVTDYVLYHELIHVGKGFDPFGQRHGADFRALERLYPMQREAEEWLRKLRLYL
ncbi:MAG: hypothetical protein FWD81_03625 [Methanomassiliicoccaceae archaeon]|nr:hypothetical protein [Methanomassiliicoccaceae archaeon]